MSSKLKWHLTWIFGAVIVILFSLLIEVGKQSTDEFVSIVINQIDPKIPTDENLANLENEMEDVLTYLSANQLEKEEISTMFQAVQSSVVCSDANDNFNILEEKYFIYEERSDEIQSKIAELETSYNEYLELVDNIPLFSFASRGRIEQGLKERIGPKYISICEQRDTYVSEREEVDNMYISAKKIADDFYEEYYELMCHIVNAEAGWLDYSSVAHLYTPEEIEAMKSLERCKVAKVIENRVKSAKFPNTLRAVIYAPGQYAPVSSGTINREPYPQTRIDMENYLRGRVDTGFSDNVLYQALFTQGKGVCEHSPSGHYFCYG